MSRLNNLDHPIDMLSVASNIREWLDYMMDNHNKIQRLSPNSTMFIAMNYMTMRELLNGVNSTVFLPKIVKEAIQLFSASPFKLIVTEDIPYYQFSIRAIEDREGYSGFIESKTILLSDIPPESWKYIKL